MTDESLSSRRLPLLDHGYVSLVESWGSDERIIEAARMSTQKGFEGWGVEQTCTNCIGSGREPGFGPNHNCRSCGGRGVRIEQPGDEKLLRYLWTNQHSTPFELAGAVFEIQAPIFVFREWHRHRTQSFNEASARYSPLPDLNYVPTVERLLSGGGHLTKQAASAAGAPKLDELGAKCWQSMLDEQYANAQRVYEVALENGVPKELARLILPVGRYSRMRASANLRNWLGFLTLRLAPQAQWEIRQYAEAVRGLLAPLFPRTLALFDEGRSER